MTSCWGFVIQCSFFRRLSGGNLEHIQRFRFFNFTKSQHFGLTSVSGQNPGNTKLVEKETHLLMVAGFRRFSLPYRLSNYRNLSPVSGAVGRRNMRGGVFRSHRVLVPNEDRFHSYGRNFVHLSVHFSDLRFHVDVLAVKRGPYHIRLPGRAVVFGVFSVRHPADDRWRSQVFDFAGGLRVRRPQPVSGRDSTVPHDFEHFGITRLIGVTSISIVFFIINCRYTYLSR